MKLVEKIKGNVFFVLLLIGYLILTLIKPDLGMASIKSSGYFIKEMLMIMPVIFILTALLDLWVPKEKIMELLGKEAKAKGIFLSFLVGSISAGPVYAAFPMCAMLRKKGASVGNCVIILSSWAVIKIPMLVNEAKFLGPSFMALRWVLTVIAILLFSGIMEKVMKEEDFPETSLDRGLIVNRDACMGCSICAKAYPQLFYMMNKKAYVRLEDGLQLDHEKLETVLKTCPVKAISYGMD